MLLLGQLAIVKNDQGQGYGADLISYAMRTALHVFDIIGCMGVITHLLDDSVRSFYRAWSFQDLHYDPRRGMIVRMIDLSGISAGNPKADHHITSWAIIV